MFALSFFLFAHHSNLQLYENGVSVKEPAVVDSDDVDTTGPRKQEFFFRPDSRVVIPTRNLRREPKYKGCAFQIESANDMKTFMAPTLAEKNAWARKVNMVLADLKSSGRYAFVVSAPDGENANPTTPTTTGKQGALKLSFNSAEKQLQQRAGVQQLAMSLQSQRVASCLEVGTPSAPSATATPQTEPTVRVLKFGTGVTLNVDRSSEIDALQKAIQDRERALSAKETELTDALQRLQREQQYRETITAGVEKWREEVTKQGNEKLEQTRARLEDEQKRVDTLEKEKQVRKAALEAANATITQLRHQVRELEAHVLDSNGLRAEIHDLRARLDKEMAFVQVLEQDTKQMAEELMEVGGQFQELKVNYKRDTHALREECSELKATLSARDEEIMQLKAEVGQLRVENKRLQDGQHKMHRELFFSMALSIKLSLAQQGCYSNADLNMLYEQILSVEYSQWHKWLEQTLRKSEVEAATAAPAASAEEHHVPSTPLGAPTRRAQPERSTKKKGFFW